MSTFAVTIQRVATVENHPNADRLDIVKIVGMDYQFIVGRGQILKNSLVVYFPLDSIIPDRILDKIGLKGKLSGRLKNRVKTIKLRGQLSQGVVVTPSKLFSDGTLLTLEDAQLLIHNKDVTEQLGVTKYEPPVVYNRPGNLKPLPDFVGKYDLENAQKYPHLVEWLMDKKVYITEKIEGSHWGATYYPETDEFFVLQRNFHIEEVEGEEHTWWKVARDGDFAAKLRSIINAFNKYFNEINEKINSVTIRGEIVGPGIQGNYYQLSDHKVYVFEIEINGGPLSPNLFIGLCSICEIITPPLLAFNETLSNWVNGRSLETASIGTSQLTTKLREGIVIKPMVERMTSEIGRLVLKQRSPEYLLKADC